MIGDRVSEGEGRVELFWYGEWGTVCSNSFDDGEARVICLQLGYVHGFSNVNISVYGEGSGPIMLDDTRCRGSEGGLLTCGSRNILEHNCVHAQDAGVRCYVPGMTYDIPE